MKKKLIATLVAGAVLSTGIIGLTACGGLSMQKGEQLADGTAWTKAFEESSKMKSYTVEANTSSNATVNGTVKLGDVTTSVENKTTMSGKYLCLYNENGNGYGESQSSGETKTVADDVVTEEKGSYIAKSYSVLSEENGGNKSYWVSEYTKEESEGTEGKKIEESYWKTEESSYPVSDYYLSQYLAKSYYTDDKDTTASKTIVELYDSFTYDGGVYTANLYMRERIYESVYVRAACTVKISFKNGYVISFEESVDASDKYEVSASSNEIKLEYTVKGKVVCNITGINETDASKKETKDITKAMDKAKAEKEKNKN